MTVPKRVVERIQSRLKAYQQVLESQRARDVSESDTVTVVKDLLSDIFGYDKYAELTSEHSIRGTYCDLAIKIDGKLAFLIEVKAIGLSLKESHIKQAVDYASNQGCEWVVLTNGIEWFVYHILFKKPIDKQEVAHFDLLAMNYRASETAEKLYLLTREGWLKSAVAEYRDFKDASSKYVVAALLLHSEAVTNAIRREVRRISDVMVDPETITKTLREQVIKREVIEGEQAESASRKVNRLSDRSIKRSFSQEQPASGSSGGTAAEGTP